MRVGELFFGLGFDVDTVKLNDVVTAIGKLNLNSVLAAVGMAGLVDGLKNIMDTASALTEDMYKFQAVTGLSGEKMKQWDEYAQRMGASAGFVEGSLKQLNMLYGQFLTGNADAGTIKSFMAINQALHHLRMPVLNENDLKDPFAMLQKITVAMQEIKKNNPSLAANILSWTHIGDQLLLIKSFDAANNIPVPNEKQIENLRNYNAAWTTVGQTLQLVFTDIASDYAPSLIDLANHIQTVEMNLHKMGISLRDVTDFILGVIALNTPLGRVVYLLYMVLTHMKEIDAFSKKAGNWVHKVAMEATPTSADLRRNDLGLHNFTLSKIGELINLYSPLSPANAKSPQVVMTNTFHIVANDIKDFEHKVESVISKAISNSYRQNSTNY